MQFESMSRKIRIKGPCRFEFLPYSSFEDEWPFLTQNDIRKEVAGHSAFLKFHTWLSDNLETSDESREPSWIPMLNYYAEGFYKFEIVVIASICELALGSVLWDEFIRNPTNECLSKCFQNQTPRITKLSKTAFKDSSGVEGEIAFVSKKITPKAEADIKFNDLIEAANSLHIINETIQKRLHKLRKKRNSVHLKDHINQRQANGRISKRDVTESQNLMESLKTTLGNWLENNYPPQF